MASTIQQLFDLSDRVAIVTGGAGWLGTAMSEALAEAGARVVVASRTPEKCQALVDRLPGDHVALEVDITDEASIRSTIDHAAQRMGRIDILVNNAYAGRGPNIDEATAEDFDVSLTGGVTSYFVAAQQTARHMRTQGGGGSIVNIGSMYGMVASYPSVYVDTEVNSPPNYHAVKGAVLHLTRHLAAYWAAEGIRVNAISPGPFPKDDAPQITPEFRRRLEEKVPLGRLGRPDEMKGAVVYLASDAASYVTGHNLVIDGGWTAW
jgi:NAD(P)-dependent dehydrogenase (short-subunit alcohol dehydrogenase family)